MNRLIPKNDLFKSSLLPVVLIVLAATLPYLQNLHYPFILDDTPNIVENPVIQELGRFLNGAGFHHRPLRFIGNLSLALNYHFGGLDVFGYHMVNIAIHAATSLLVYALIRLTFRTPWLQSSSLAVQGPLIALATALLFAVHPIQTQAVTYIVQRFASLTTMFYLLALVLYVSGRLTAVNRDPEIVKAVQSAGTPGGRFDQADSRFPIPVSRFPSHGSRSTASLLFSGSAVAAVLAMLTKEIAFTLPLMVLLLEFSFFPESRLRRFMMLGGALVMTGVMLVLMASTDRPLGEIFAAVDGLLRENQHVSRWDYLMTQFRVIVSYLRLLFFPVNQNLDYNLTVFHTFFTAPVFLSFLLLLGLFMVALYLYRFRFKFLSKSPVTSHQSRIQVPGSRFPDPESRIIAFGILWFFLTLSVESSIIPIADVMVEHRLYLPSIGIALAVTVAVALLGRRVPGRGLLALLMIVVIIFGVATVRRNQVWSDPVILWSDTALKSPMNERAWCNLGMAQLDAGAVEAGIVSLLRSAAINPAYAKTHLNLGVAFGRLGRLPEAAQALEKALAISPKLWLAHANLGTIYGRMGQMDMAIRHLDTTLKLNPGDDVARRQLERFRRYQSRIPTQK